MFVILSGVSGAGKDTICKELKKRMNNLEGLPSYTTRAPRKDDIAGVTYNFVTKEEFEEMIKNNEFYEYDIHHQNYYGTSRKILKSKLESGKIIIKDIEVNGTENLIKLLKDDTRMVTIFLRVPKEELRRRLHKRIDKLSDEEIELRLSRLEFEESKMNIYDYVIKNDDLEKTVAVIENIIKIEKNIEDKMQKSK